MNPPSLRQACRAAFRRNLVPGLVIQAVALAVLAAYFFWPGSQSAFATIGDLKGRWGLGFSALATALFGGAIPFLAMLALGRIPKGQASAQGIFYIVYWTFQGVVVDLLYSQQARWFGTGNDLPTLIKKVLVDQGPFNLLYATPCAMLAYRWKDAGFSWTRLRNGMDRRAWAFEYPAIQVSSWTVWVPAVCMIYTLPPNLQVPLFNLVLCFFTLVLAMVAGKGGGTSA
jgi:hypothetical protein